MIADPLPEYPTGSGFGEPRGVIAGINFGMHNGIDKVAPGGTPVPAAASGRVIHTAAAFVPCGHLGAGNHVHIEHPGGLETRCSHLMARYVAVGQMVIGGQTIIGSVGATGTATGNHLHFEVLLNGEHVDPALYIGGGSMPPSAQLAGNRQVPQRDGKTCVSLAPDPRTMRATFEMPGPGGTCPAGFGLANAQPYIDAPPSNLGEALGLVLPPMLEPALNLAILGGAMILIYAGVKRTLSA